MNIKQLKIGIIIALASTIIATPAYAAPTIFDQLATITQGFGNVKNFIIYAAFLVGLGGIVWGVMDMFKKSQARGGDDATWMGIGIKFLGGVLLVSLTVTSDIGKATFLGSTTTSTTTSNFN